MQNTKQNMLHKLDIFYHTCTIVQCS